MIHIRRVNEMANANPIPKAESAKIMRKLESEKRNYELQGVELTDEDVETVVNFMNNDGLTMEEAVAKTLEWISDCLS